MSKILVYGSTGSQGNPVVHALLKKGHEVHAVTRGADKAAGLTQAGAHAVIADMTDAASLKAASAGMDAVYLLVPFGLPNPTLGPVVARNVIDAAKDAGVKLIVWNTSGPVLPARTGDPIFDFRFDVGEALRASGVPFIELRPTGYMENWLGPWTAPEVARENRIAYPNPAEQRVGWIASADVAALAAEALERPELAPAVFSVSGLENANGDDLARAFSAGLGRDITYRAMPLEEFGATMDAVFGPGAGAGAVAGYQRMRDMGDRIPMHFDMGPVLEKLPARMTSIEDWVRQHKAAFEPHAAPMPARV